MSADRLGAAVGSVIEEMIDRAGSAETDDLDAAELTRWANRLGAATRTDERPTATEAARVMQAAVAFADDPTLPASALPDVLDDLIAAARRLRCITTS